MPKSLTVLQQTNSDGFPKAGELIDIIGAFALEASDRAILNLLYQHAHDSGRMGEADARWEIPMSSLRFASSHKGNERIGDSLNRILSVVVNISVTEPETGEPRTLRTHLFDFFEDSTDEGGERATVRFGLPKELQPILARSNRWGRIKAEVVCAMTSKYAIALYEMVQLRANMDRCLQEFDYALFRGLLGVPPGAYERGANFAARVTDPAALEVNGVSDVGVKIELNRRSRFAPITSVTLAWWKKQGDEFQVSIKERNRSKVGRMARLRGEVETVAPPAAA